MASIHQQHHGNLLTELDVQVHEDAQALLGLIQQTREGQDGSKHRAGALPSDGDLAALTFTAQGLANKLQSIRNHRHKTRRTRNRLHTSAQCVLHRPGSENGGGERVSEPTTSSASTSAATSRPAPRRHSPCNDCNRTKTPEWRAGPTGPEALCNVCGLLYAKRMLRMQGL
ncbi:Zinc finger- GATA-type [Apiospora kogelbergensis]|uniref:Zinc finger- GATA-type n=1 Tax=Apiospora kogelbergensis TaxID=1337665 RepID=UPI00312F3316